MKKLTLTIALVLCLVLCAFAFASCGKKKAAATTAEQATAAATTAAQTTAAPATTTTATPTPPPHEHTPEANPTVDQKPTCSSPGEQSYYCEECGEKIPGTTEPIPIDPKAHRITEWTVTEPVNMFHVSGRREGYCPLCEQTIGEDLTFEPTIEAFTASSGKYNTETVYYKDVLGDKHFYPTESDPDGNDLLVEFSILWNETIENFDPSADCYMCGRFEGGKPLYYFSPVVGCPTSDAAVAGAFEWMGNFTTPISDAEVTTPATMCSKSSNYADYPNIMGADPDHPEYGWHRVGIRYHLELLDGKSGADLTDYVGIATCFVDGVAIFKLSTGTDGMQNWESMLFKAESDGEGGIVYSDAGDYVIPFIMNKSYTKADTTAYLAFSDVYVTCGKDFVMKVEKVASPEAQTLEVAEGVDIPAPVYFKLAN